MRSLRKRLTGCPPSEGAAHRTPRRGPGRKPPANLDALPESGWSGLGEELSVFPERSPTWAPISAATNLDRRLG
jgi:hypothetical protein